MSHHHGPGCGHQAVVHQGHIDFIVAGRLEDNSGQQHPLGNLTGSDQIYYDHDHGPNCGHEAVEHEDHLDYLVNGRLHHPHDKHCHDHGALIETEL